MKTRTITTRILCSLAAFLLGAAALNTRAATLTWDNGQANMFWDTTSANWSGTALWNNATPDSAVFGATGVGTVTLGEPITVGNITFDAAGYLISGDTLTLSNSTIIANAAAEISSVLAGTNGLAKAGADVLTLSAANTFSGGLAINAGTLVSAGPLPPNNHTITVNAGTTLLCALGNYCAFPMPNPPNGGCTLNIFGGTVSVDGASQNAHNIMMTTVVMQGGTLTSINGVAGPADDGGWGNYNLNGYDSGGGGSPSSINVIGPGQSTISSTTLWCNNGGVINVGVTGAGIDLLVLSKITGASTVIKNGPGTMAVTGENDYTAGTTINAGTLLLNNSTGSGTGSGAVTVNAGGTLGGTGTISGAVTNMSGGTLAPGDSSIGTLNFAGTLTLDAGSTNVMRINKTGSTLTADKVNLTGASGIAYNGTLTVISNAGSAAFAPGDKFTLFAKNTGTFTGSFGTLNLPALGPGLVWYTGDLAVDGSILVLSTTAAATPTFDPPAGIYVGEQAVSIRCATTGATIHYTTDNTTPNTSSPIYSSPIPVPVNTTMTIKAFAKATGYADSAVGSASYVTEAVAIWTNPAGGSWAATSNWTNSIVGQGRGSTNYFNALTLPGDTVVTLDSSPIVGSLFFGDLGYSYSWTINAGSPTGTLTLDAAGPSTIQVDNQTTTIAAKVAGTNGLIKTGDGTLTLSGANTFSGGLTINAGTLVSAGPPPPNNHTITVNAGTTLSCALGNYCAFPMPNPPNGGCTLNIFGGTVSVDGASQNAHNIMMTTVVMQGGTLTSINGVAGPADDGGWGNYNLNGYDSGGGGSPSSINVIGPGQSTISSTTLWCNNGGAINVGVTGAGIDLLVSSRISGASTVIKNGPGTMAVTGDNNYTGGTTINAGRLLANNSAASGTGSGSVTVNAAGTLGGTGTVTGDVTVNGTLAPGDSNIGTLTLTSTLTTSGSGTNLFRINNTGGLLTSDQVQGLPSVTYGGVLRVTATGDALANGDSFILFPFAGSYQGSFAAFDLPPLAAGLSWEKSYLTVDGSIRVVSYAATPLFTPPPGSYAASVSVTISSDAGTTIHYTTDGSDPTTSGTAQTGPSPLSGVIVPVQTNLTIRAYASKTGLGDSAVASGTYVTWPTSTWTSLAGGSWPDTNNWTSGFVGGGGSGVTADFSTLTLVGDAYVTLDGPRMIGNMIFGDVGNGFNWDLSTGGGGPLTLDAGTNTPTITVSNMTTTIEAVLAGTNGLTKTGNGTLSLSAANTFSGGLAINAGTLVSAGPLPPNNHTITVNAGTTLLCALGNYCAFPMPNPPNGGCTLNIFGGTVSVDGASQNAHNIMMTTVVMQGGTLTSINGVAGPANDGGWGNYNINGYDFGGGGSPSSINVIGPGQSTISSTTLWCNNGGAINVGVTGAGIDLLVLSKITGASTVIKNGPGTMAVTGNNDYTAGTTINEGTLLVNNSAGSGTGSGAVTVNAGGTLGGTGAVGGAVALIGTVAPGGTVGTLATGSETWNGGGVYVFQLSSATNSVGWDRLNITGTLKVQVTSGSKFTLKLASMASATTPGLVPDFSSTSNYTWTVATASGGILNFAPAQFAVDAGGFSNAYAGSFSVGTNGNALVVSYTAGLTTPTLSAYGPLSGNSFPLTFSGPNGQTYTVLATTNVALPIASWIPLTAGTFGGSPVTYTDTSATNQARFYRIISP